MHGWLLGLHPGPDASRQLRLAGPGTGAPLAERPGALVPRGHAGRYTLYRPASRLRKNLARTEDLEADRGDAVAGSSSTRSAPADRAVSATISYRDW